jgi:uncharacterized LabA/DUF88 family protein
MARVIILIDGSNFYFKLKELKLSSLLSFNFSSFAKFLIKETKSVKIIQATYYVGAIRADRSRKSKKLHANQRRLLARLRSHNFTYYLGYLLKSDGVFKEKGVDVKIATDLLLGACKNRYDQAFVVSSDSDLVPAIEGAQDLGRVVTYVGFKHQPSYALLQACRRSILLTKEDLAPFFIA